MLIFLQDTPKEDLLWYQSDAFDLSYDTDWFENKYVLDMIKDIDNTELITDGIFKSEVLGNIPATELSTGVKGLILILLENDYIFRSSYFGDNCSKWILDISKDKDIFIDINHFLGFPEFNDDDGYKLYFKKTDTTITNRIDYLRYMIMNTVV